MHQFSRFIIRFSGILDRMAGLCLFAAMLLVIVNIILRVTVSRPILGTYEIVGFLTALGIALALAQCAVKNGHIAVGFIVDRFPKRIQTIVDSVIYAVSFVFMTAAVWYLGNYAHSMKMNGLVSPSAEIPIYPFIYLVALGMLGLCMVLLYKLLESLRNALNLRQRR